MKYAIIAAGEGSRLAQEGIDRPKPLVEVNGQMLIDRLISVFLDNDAEEICVICNEKMTAVARHLEQIKLHGLRGRAVPLSFIVRSTPSSMHSLHELSGMLQGAPFCLTTVDTIFRSEEFAAYIRAFRQSAADGSAQGLMAVTDYIDDEKPLYVATDPDLRITGFLDQSTDCRFISGGIYGLMPEALNTLSRCIERGEQRMRNFQRALIADGLRLRAYPFGKILDIDHATDIRKAEEFLQGEGNA